MNKQPYITLNQSGLSDDEVKKLRASRKRELGREGTTLAHTDFTVADGNFDTTRQEIKVIVLHTVVGTVQSAMDVFGSVGRGTSAHYVVGLDGKLFHGLEEYYTAFHSGNYAINQSSIGIEHADNGDYNGPRTPQLYEKSSQLVADICKAYAIPARLITRAQATAGEKGVIDHRNITLSSTACPDSLDIMRIITGAANLLTPPSQPIDFKSVVNESKKYVFGYQTEGAVTQRMAKIVEIYKKYKVTK